MISDPDPARPTARLLDLTRLIRRAGRRMTGVDRVEYAYLDHLVAGPVPLFGLVRTSLGYLLIDHAGCRALRDAAASDAWPTVGITGWLGQRAPGAALARRLAVARCLPAGLARMLHHTLPAGTHYLNIGHSNLTPRVLSALRRIDGLRIGVLVHDTIPLDVPQFQRPGTPQRFRAFLDRALIHADLIICNSEQTRRDIARHAPAGRALPQMVVAHLGVPVPVVGTAPHGPWRAPYFVALGTIEPRKNHALLLDLWADMGNGAPDLVIVGARGWENRAVFDRLDAAPPKVHEVGGLPDATAFALLAGSAGLLFPSHAEGYGLPPIEAAALGVPVLCNDLDVVREVLGDIPVYAQVADRYSWHQGIVRLAAAHPSGPRGTGIQPPGWQSHFDKVLTRI